MEKTTLTKEQKEYIHKYLKRKTYIFFLYLCAIINQCLLILLGGIVMCYNPNLSWFCLFVYILGAIPLCFFINLIVDYSEEQKAKDAKEDKELNK